MATGSVYNDLTEIISCQICLEEFQDQNPRQLSCLHVFCEQCVENLLIKSQTVNSDCPGNVICPVCKAKSDVPGGCAANLPIFFHSRKIEDVRKQLDERHTVCKICQTDTHKAYVSSYCLQSCSGLCNACRLKHDKRHPNHSLIAVSATTINSIMCPSHDTHFEYYCMTCGTSICGKCYLGPHSDHQIFGLSYDSKEANIEIKELLMSELESADQALTRLDNIQDAVTDDMKKIRSEIDHDHKVQLTQLNERHETLCADLDKTEERIIEDIIKSRNLLQDAQQQLKKLLEGNQSWLDPVKGISEAHVTGVGELVSTIVQHIPSTEAVMIKQPKVIYLSDEHLINLGKLVVHPSAMTPMSETKPLDTLQKGYLECIDLVPKLIGEISSSVHDVDILPGGKIIVAAGDSVYVYNEYGLQVTHKVTDMCKPLNKHHFLYGVGAHKTRDVIAVTDLIIKNNTTNEDCTIGYLHVYNNGCYNKYDVCGQPLSVVITNNCEYIITNQMDNYIYKYGSNGMFMWRKNIIERPESLFMDDQDMTVVCSAGDVLILRQNGQKVLSLEDKNPNIYAVSAVITGPKRHILISDINTNSVSVYRENGDFVKHLIRMNYRPGKIAVYEDNYLVVFSNRLLVYKLK